MTQGFPGRRKVTEVLDNDPKKHEVTSETYKPFIDKKNKCKCAECGKSFPCQAKLKHHIEKHLGIKRFQCDMCNERFRERFHLTKHTFVHGDEGATEMKIKKHGSATGTNIKTRGGTTGTKTKARGGAIGTKSFQCDKCDKCFAQRCQVKEHMAVHGDQVFKCTMCNSRCKHKKNLQTHIKLVHGVTTT